MATVPKGHPEKPQGAHGTALLERMNGGHHEELALWGMSHLTIPEDGHALDIGCGGGANIERLLARMPEGRVCGIDYSPLSVEVSRAHNALAIEQDRCTVLEGNASDIPFPNATFDLVTAFETTYYWDLPTAFAEVGRVLKPAGLFLVCNEDDGCDLETAELAKQIPHMSVLTAEMLEGELLTAGFSIVRTERIPHKGYLAIVAQRRG